MVEGTSGACALTETDTHGWEHASKACHVSAHVLTSGALLAGDLVPQPCVVFPRGDHIVRISNGSVGGFEVWRAFQGMERRSVKKRLAGFDSEIEPEVSGGT